MLRHHVLRQKVRSAYSAASQDPYGRHPFPVGRIFAESLGYSPEWLRQLPAESVEAFTGVSNVSVFAQIARGATVLDLGCGAGLDSLLAARRTGSTGRVLGVDFSGAMLARARFAAAEAAAENVLFCQAEAEALPIAANSMDVALVNGIFNLNPAREAIFGELARTLRVGASVYGAELILREPVAAAAGESEESWFA